jgi:multiple antibiotic resistance protein
MSLPVFLIPVDFIENLIKSTIALLVVIDPIGNVPLFIALTQRMEKNEMKAVSKIAVLTAAVLLMVFAIAGSQILAIFGISINSFMIAGGVLLFIVSIELLTYGIWRFGATKKDKGKQEGEEEPTAIGESGVVPLAFPLLAGPGAITSVMISYQSNGLIITTLSISIVIAITYIVLRLANRIYKLLGRRGSMIFTRVFAVLVAAIAVQYIVQGVRHLFA